MQDYKKASGGGQASGNMLMQMMQSMDGQKKKQMK